MEAKISVIIIAKNEEKNIEKCLKSVKWCDEIIVIDDKSSDKTLEIARNYNAIAYSNALNGDFSLQRNFGLSKAKNSWVLFLDADEVISDALAYEMLSSIHLKDQNLKNFSGFCIKRVDFIWRKRLRYGETGNAWRLRLAKKNSGQWVGKVHERWMVNGLVGKLVNPIYHFPHDGELEKFLTEINNYTDIKTEELSEKKTNVLFLSILIFPMVKFLINYFAKRGFLDGIPGLIIAIMMSFHSFLVRGKLWLSNNEK